MNRISVIFLMLLAATTLQAQHIHAYATAGTIISQIEGDELKGFNHWNFTGGIGAIANLDDRDRWALTVETDYSCRGVFNQKHNSKNYYNINLNLHYVDIPVTLFFHDPYGDLRIGLGLVYSRLVAQPHGTISYNPTYFVPDSTSMAFLKNDLAPAIEFRFNLWKRLQLSARYQYSIIPIKKDWTFTMFENSAGDFKTWSNKCYNSSLSFRLLWLFGDDDAYSHSKKRRFR